MASIKLSAATDVSRGLSYITEVTTLKGQRLGRHAYCREAGLVIPVQTSNKWVLYIFRQDVYTPFIAHVFIEIDGYSSESYDLGFDCAANDDFLFVLDHARHRCLYYKINTDNISFQYVGSITLPYTTYTTKYKIAPASAGTKGRVLAISDPYAVDGTTGSVYVYKYADGYSLDQTITGPAGLFGYQVGVLNDEFIDLTSNSFLVKLAISSPEEVHGSYTGLIRIYDYDDFKFSETYSISSNTDNFGKNFIFYIDTTIAYPTQSTGLIIYSEAAGIGQFENYSIISFGDPGATPNYTLQSVFALSVGTSEILYNMIDIYGNNKLMYGELDTTTGKIVSLKYDRTTGTFTWVNDAARTGVSEYDLTGYNMDELEMVAFDTYDMVVSGILNFEIYGVTVPEIDIHADALIIHKDIWHGTTTPFEINVVAQCDNIVMSRNNIKKVYGNALNASYQADYIVLNSNIPLYGVYAVTMEFEANLYNISNNNNRLYYSVDNTNFTYVSISPGIYTMKTLQDTVNEALLNSPYPDIVIFIDTARGDKVLVFGLNGVSSIITLGSPDPESLKYSMHNKVLGFPDNTNTFQSLAFISSYTGATLASPTILGVDMDEGISLTQKQYNNPFTENSLTATYDSSVSKYKITTADAQKIKLFKKTNSLTFRFNHIDGGATAVVDATSIEVEMTESSL